MSSLDIAPAPDERTTEILSDEALAFISELHGRFNARRLELLQARRERKPPSGFLPDTEEIRDGDWQVPPPRPDYADRRVEITGPTDRKLVINALNSGAKGFMADFEDANSPTWRNQVEGHVNLIDAIEGTITYDSSEGKKYELAEETATLLVRPRGWHLPEKHLKIDGEAVSGALVDFGLHAFHNARRLHEKNLGLYLYEQNEVDGAIAQFEEALRLSPRMPDAHTNLGMALSNSGQPLEAIPHFEQALAERPSMRSTAPA